MGSRERGKRGGEVGKFLAFRGGGVVMAAAGGRRHALRRVSELQSVLQGRRVVVRRAWAVGSGRELPQPSMAERVLSPLQRQTGINCLIEIGCNGRRNIVWLIALVRRIG
jgi:hypothetical protein